MTLEGRVVVVTGASMGIGEALARSCARRGAKLALAARSPDRLEKLASELGGRAIAIQADVTQYAGRTHIVEQTLASLGRIDVLVNNAGAGMYASTEATDPDEVRRLFELNVFAPLELVQAVLPHMKKTGGQIVNVSSVAGHVGLPFMGAYCATKFALRAFNDAMRIELKPHGIHVIGVYPGRVRSQFQANVRGSRSSHPMRWQAGGISSEECAEAIVRAVLRDRRDVVVPGRMRAVIDFANGFPGMMDRILARVFR